MRGYGTGTFSQGLAMRQWKLNNQQVVTVMAVVITIACLVAGAVLFV